MQGNHHDKAPGWTAVVTQRLSINCRMTSLAMNRGYRFESMQSSGMRHLCRVESAVTLKDHLVKAKSIMMLSKVKLQNMIDKKIKNQTG